MVTLAGCQAGPSPRQDAGARSFQALPAAAEQALTAHNSPILYSLEPRAPRVKGDQGLLGFQVLGKTALSDEDAEVAVKAFRSAIGDWVGGSAAACFDPRHAIRVLYGEHTYDFLLCYQCQSIWIYEDGKILTRLGAAGSPKELNALLTAAGVPLSTSG
ncbi:hypothetical protein [Aliidongia dinghuensis]|nr:hypothetical protein [Aliidongia dinghuensis]